MNKEDKQLLLKDLCMRLPYGVKCLVTFNDGTKDIMTLKTGLPNSFGKWDFYNEKKYSVCSDNFKPYLHPMSSMTEEEMEELKTLCSIYIPTDSPTIGFEDYGITVLTHHLTNNTYSFKLNLDIIDWLNVHHFDYRGLIEKGLALKAPEGMYN